MSNNYRAIVQALATARPHMKASTLTALADAVVAVVEAPPADLKDSVALARWAETQPAVMEMVRADKKIQAIKELRTLTGGGLAECKYACDILMGYEGIVR